MNKTKIVATVGPASQDKEVLRSMILKGMDVVRINLSHAEYDFCREMIKKLDELNDELNTNVAVMLDTQGPDIRVDNFIGGSAFFRKGDKIRIYMEEVLGDSTKFSINYPNLINDVDYNNIIKVNDGKIEMKVLDKDDNSIICEVLNDGQIFNNKGVNVPGVKLNRPFISKKDRADILFANEMKVDFLALSFVGSADDVLDVNDLLIESGNDHINIIAKIENERAVESLDEIIKVSDGIMVARGDLGAEIPAERIPGIQKNIINQAHVLGKFTIVATEMLSSMEKSIVPTRAEVSDVANAVLDGADAVMLSGETTIGKYPIETVEMMEKIIGSAEEDINYIEFLDRAMRTEKQDTTGLISYSVAECAMRLKCKAIMVPTMTGYTARKMSRFRPVCPIVALSPKREVIKSLALYFGVHGVLVDELKTFDKIQEIAKKEAREFVKLIEGEKVIITGGYPMKDAKHTNFMHIEEL
jgi:pyruvate kinase